MTLYRIVKTQMVDGDQYAMDGAMYMGRLVPVELDYEAAAKAKQNRLNAEDEKWHTVDIDHNPWHPQWEDVPEDAKVLLIDQMRLDVNIALGIAQ